MRFKIVLVTLISILLISFPLMAGSHYDETVDKNDVVGKVNYSGTVTFADSASGAAYYTQAMAIGGMTDAYGYAYFICSEAGTEDVNVFVEYSNDKLTWVAGTTDSDLDAVGTTAVEDTIGIVQGAMSYKYKSWLYMRLKFVAGQAINSTTVTWTIGFNKNSGVDRTNLARVSNRDT